MADEQDKSLDDLDPKKEMERMRQMQESFQKELDQLHKKTGLTPKQMKDFLGNPKNFTERQWKLIQDERKKYDKKLEDLVGRELVQESKNKQKKKGSSGASKKLLGKKRGWVEMD